MHELCFDHKNKIERICIHPECENRALCLLCDHPHGNPFESIMVKKSAYYKSFQSILNQAFDHYLIEKQQTNQYKVFSEQKDMITKYFHDLKYQMDKFLSQTEKRVMKTLQSDQQENFLIIKRARISKNYVKLPSKIFKILLSIYEGTPFSEVFKNNQSGKTQQTYDIMLQLHNSIQKIMQSQHFVMKTKLPDIRRVLFQEKAQKFQDNQTNYEVETTKRKYTVKLLNQSTTQFDSIISDCQRFNDMLLTCSFDKKIRLFDQNLNLKAENQYSNILTRIHQIADNVFAIGHSKELVIENIRYGNNSLVIQQIMKLRGHTERINDIHCLNSRIIGSSSSQGVKIWDLYKEKCQYTLKDQGNPSSIRFIPMNNTLVVGLNSHCLKLYSVQTMKLIKKYELSGVPLVIDQGKFTQHMFYVGGFNSNLAIVDTRLNKLATQIQLKQDAVTCVIDSINDQFVVGTGDRDGNCNLIDMRTKKSRVTWEAHTPKTSMSKPRGIVGLFENSQTQWTTIGCNDKSLKTWSIENADNTN